MEADLENLDRSPTAQTRHSFLHQTEAAEPEQPSVNEEQEMFAEELASAVMKVALREACVEPFQRLRSDEEEMDESGRERLILHMDTETDAPQLYPSGLPVMGSLDYPDAPPTTPLLPELQRSRRSFVRQLKGGLARVFLPSPPPPTPKEKEDGGISPRMELVEHVIHSLSTDDSTRHRFQAGAKMEAFAEALSSDVIDWLLRGREKMGDDNDLHLLAQRLAGTIISSSIHEAQLFL